MNEIVNKFLLARDMPEIYLRQPWFSYVSSKSFTKNKERIKNN